MTIRSINRGCQTKTANNILNALFCNYGFSFANFYLSEVRDKIRSLFQLQDIELIEILTVGSKVHSIRFGFDGPSLSIPTLACK